jgi:diguanylate cyclase (GGDEF)-like protein/PAS domain S-box-containing protein
LVHDSHEDAGALLNELERCGYQPAARRVGTAEEMKRALAESEWDIILADYETRLLGALSALELLREQELDTPFVIVSDAIGQETAVGAIKAGAHNLIKKTALPRLLPTVEQELREARSRREQREAHDALRESETRFRALFETASDGILLVDASATILFANRAAESLFRQPGAAMIGLPLPDFIPGFTRSFKAQIERRRKGRGRRHPWEPVELVGIVGGEREVPLELTFGDFETKGKRLFTVIARDLTGRKRAEARVAHLAFHDPLTELPNRLLFHDRLAVAVAQAQRRGAVLATLFLDLDRFKVINDSLGHSVGDRLLCKVAERLRTCVRETDTLARLGGDEFIMLVQGISSEADALRVARKIQLAMRQPFPLDERDLFVTTSIGIAMYPADGKDAESLIHNADTALYRAKDLGSDNAQLYTPAMNTKALKRLAIEGDLRLALRNNQLAVHYQPIVDLKTGRVRGAEALLRWQHPEMGLLPPDEFIPLAEISGQIIPIGDWVLRTACAQVRKWQERHNGPVPLSVAVNLSARQLLQRELAPQVARVLEETNLPRGSLELEITESDAIQNVELSIATLTELRKLGVTISMDDFGTGYSSLSYLRRLPIDRIKIDRSFVQDVSNDPDEGAHARAVIAMAHILKMSVIAEGVETPDQLAFLAKHGCDQMQGFIFSEPVAAPQVEAQLAMTLAALPAPAPPALY